MSAVRTLCRVTAKDTTDIDSFLEELPSNVNCNHNLSFEGIFIKSDNEDILSRRRYGE
jgi:hypothetical protein